MFELRPADAESMAFYLGNLVEYTQCADGLGVPVFSHVLREELRALLADPDALCLVESVTRFSGFNDAEDLESMRKAVSKILRSKGTRLPKGKRADHGLVELVGRLTPLLLFYGMPLATNERSVLVRALRLIADEVGVRGDPRDELRRRRRLERQHAGKGYAEFLEAVARGISPD